MITYQCWFAGRQRSSGEPHNAMTPRGAAESYVRNRAQPQQGEYIDVVVQATEDSKLHEFRCQTEWELVQTHAHDMPRVVQKTAHKKAASARFRRLVDNAKIHEVGVLATTTDDDA